MSGGFFRGTSADQDTRFSNKQAKLMKSQKFAPELEHLVDMTKVEMDIMRPWIANRVTELLGFEDEVLINFIYGLLEGKVVNGKEIQISLTGFMEKNTGKFMKELWTLLLSAQNNASRVPQQFLDAKEEETRNKKMEADRIKNEMLRIKEKEARELEQEKVDKMDGKVDNSSRANDASVPSLRHQPRDSSVRSATDEKQMNGRNGSRGRTRVSRSPHSVQRSPSSPRGSPSRSNSKSFSNSRSHSDERHRSGSISGSPQKRGRSVSSEKMRRSPVRRSTTPRRRDSPQRSFSPSRRRTSQFRQRSVSHSRRRSPSPIGRRLRSPIRRRSRSPMRRRSRTPVRRRSRTPVRRRSRTPVRRRSRTPLRRRSRSPLRYRSRSPIRRRSRSPLSRRSPSPIRRRSPSPLRRRYRRSPSSPRRRSPSPYRRRPTIPSRRRSPTPPGRRSSSLQELSSQSPVHQVSLSPVKRRSPKRQRSPVQSPRDKIRSSEQYSPVRHPPRENIERRIGTHKVSSLERRPPMSTLRSPQRDSSGQDVSRRKVPSLSPSPYNSPSGSESPPASRKRSLSEDRRLSSPYESPRRQTREQMIHNSRPSPPQKPIVHKLNPDCPQEEKTKVSREGEDLKYKSSGKKLTQPSTSDELKLDQQKKSEPRSRKVPQSEVSKQLSPSIYKSTLPSEGVLKSYSGEGYRADEKSQYRPNHVKGSGRHESETLSKMSRKVEEPNNCGSVDSYSEVSDKHRAEVNEKRKHKRSKRPESDDDDSYDSKLEGRKEAKRRKKEEKRLRKEERRRLREERRRRKEERRAEKIKLKSVGTVSPPSDLGENHDGYTSDGERVARREADSSDIEEAESEQKKLEIALRKKALESLRAKKGAGH